MAQRVRKWPNVTVIVKIAPVRTAHQGGNVLENRLTTFRDLSAAFQNNAEVVIDICEQLQMQGPGFSSSFPNGTDD
jgi:hypothetical protein